MVRVHHVKKISYGVKSFKISTAIDLCLQVYLKLLLRMMRIISKNSINLFLYMYISFSPFCQIVRHISKEEDK